VGDFRHIAMARESPTGVGSHNKTIAHRGGLPQRQIQRHKHRAATDKKRAACGGPFWGLAGLVRLQHVLVDQQLG
jgi:hypothetical protein